MSKVNSKVLISALLVCLSGLCWADTERLKCKPVRAPGLSNSQIEQAVLEKVAIAVRAPAASIEVRRSISDLVGADFAVISLMSVAQDISDLVGIDVDTFFVEFANTRDVPAMSRTNSIAALQALAVKAYRSSSDTPYPKAIAGDKYWTSRFVAPVPEPAKDWYMVKCHLSAIQFQRSQALSGDVTAAMVSEIMFLPYKTPAEILAQVNAATSVTVSAKEKAGYAIKSTTSKLKNQKAPLCVLTEVELEKQNLPADSLTKQLQVLVTQTCVDAKFPGSGYVVGWINQGTSPLSKVRESANDYFQRVVAVN